MFFPIYSCFIISLIFCVSCIPDLWLSMILFFSSLQHLLTCLNIYVVEKYVGCVYAQGGYRWWQAGNLYPTRRFWKGPLYWKASFIVGNKTNERQSSGSGPNWCGTACVHGAKLSYLPKQRGCTETTINISNEPLAELILEESGL